MIRNMTKLLMVIIFKVPITNDVDFLSKDDKH